MLQTGVVNTADAAADDGDIADKCERESDAQVSLTIGERHMECEIQALSYPTGQ